MGVVMKVYERLYTFINVVPSPRRATNTLSQQHTPTGTLVPNPKLDQVTGMFQRVNDEVGGSDYTLGSAMTKYDLLLNEVKHHNYAGVFNGSCGVGTMSKRIRAGRCSLTVRKPEVKNTPGFNVWFQRLKLKCDEPLKHNASIPTCAATSSSSTVASSCWMAIRCPGRPTFSWARGFRSSARACGGTRTNQSSASGRNPSGP